MLYYAVYVQWFNTLCACLRFFFQRILTFVLLSGRLGSSIFQKAVWKYFSGSQIHNTYTIRCTDAAGERGRVRTWNEYLRAYNAIYTKETFEIFSYRPNLMNKLEWPGWVGFHISLSLSSLPCNSGAPSENKKK